MPKACDACVASRAVVYCRADAAYLCVSCDGKVHGANKLASRHERVWMCEVCEVAPAVVTCKADAASLCVACDTDIHSANPLAQRHERVPITPLFESSPSPSPVPVPAPVGALPSHTTQEGLLKSEDDVDTDAISSWLLPHHRKIPANAIIRGSAAVGGAAVASPVSPFSAAKPQSMQKGILADIFSDVHPFLDLDDAAVTGIQPDSLVPVHTPEGSEDTATLKHSTQPAAFPLKGKNHLNNDNNKSSSSYGTSTLTHSMSCSSLEAAVVPESSVSDISTPYTVSTQGSLEVGARMGMPQQQQPIDVVDREARVMRYKEKRQKRKFEKTIRYASRKAYAESRPRIKGRFAKRTDSDGDQMFGSEDSGFGVVPTF